MRIYTAADCEQTGYGFALNNKAVVVQKDALLEQDSGQLFFCTGGNEAATNQMGCAVFLVSLANGEQYRFCCNDVIGTLKPELLPEEAKLQLSQIRPGNALPLESHEPQYSGYSFLPDGRYAAGVWLCSPQEVQDYVEMQKPYQHRVLICDRDDFAVMEVVDGQMIFPTLEQLEDFRQEQKGCGMEMQ